MSQVSCKAHRTWTQVCRQLQGGEGPGQGTNRIAVVTTWASPVPDAYGIGHVSHTTTHDIGTGDIIAILQKRKWAPRIYCNSLA